MNEPIIAGNKVLQPGTYVWRLLDSQSNRNIVQIFNRDESKLETTVMAIPNYRLQPTGNTQFSFWQPRLASPRRFEPGFIPATTTDKSLRFRKN